MFLINVLFTTIDNAYKYTILDFFTITFVVEAVGISEKED